MNNPTNSLPPAAGEAAHAVLLSCYCHKAFADALDAIAHADVPPAHPEYLTKGRMAELAAFALQGMAEFKPESTEVNDRLAFIVRACNAYDSDQRKIKALTEAGERLLQWVEGYQRLANEKGGRYAVAISSSRSDAELFRTALALVKGGTL